MRFIPRELEGQLLRAARSFPAVVLTGPRRAGKTALLRRAVPGASYFLLEDPDVITRLQQDPHGFLDGMKPPVILDEVQNVPEVFALVRARVDRQPHKAGQWFLTGSQESPLMQGITESMAGRAAVLQLLPVSARESSKVTLLRGGYPEVLARPAAARLWFNSYLQTYLERDVRAALAVRDLAQFRRFLALLATRHGQVLNKSDLAAPLGLSIPAVGAWLDVLELTGQVLLVPPYFENAGKRLIKSPKIYLADSGLACHLLGVDTDAELEKSPFLGALFEGFVAAEIAKAQVNAGRRRELYYFRDQQGLEVDFLLPARNGALRLIEAKASRTPVPAMATGMARLALALAAKRPAGSEIEQILVHRPSRHPLRSTALSPGAKALAWPEFVVSLNV